jgi:hypothetical protein
MFLAGQAILPAVIFDGRGVAKYFPQRSSFCWSAMRGGSLALSCPQRFLFLFVGRPGLLESCSNSEHGCRYNDFLTEVLGSISGVVTTPVLLAFAWDGLAHEDDLLRLYFASASLPVFADAASLVSGDDRAVHVLFPRAWLYLQTAASPSGVGYEFRTGVFQEISWLKLPSICRSSACCLGLGGLLIRPQMFSPPSSISLIIPMKERHHRPASGGPQRHRRSRGDRLDGLHRRYQAVARPRCTADQRSG